MSDLIERAARAIFFRGAEQDDDMWEHCQPYLRDIAREQARASIEAIRDPAPLELMPGVHAYLKVESSCRPVAFRAGWNAVLDAALSASPAPLKRAGEAS